jgi:uncharacterized membrane protein YqjE
MSRTEERPVSAVFADIVNNVEEIVRSEVRLAKAQIKNEAADAAASAVRLSYGIALTLYAIGLFLLAAVYLLSQFVPAWIAAMVVCLVVTAVALPLLVSGRRRLSYLRPPTASPINVTKENVSWMNAQSK